MYRMLILFPKLMCAIPSLFEDISIDGRVTDTWGSPAFRRTPVVLDLWY